MFTVLSSNSVYGKNLIGMLELKYSRLIKLLLVSGTAFVLIDPANSALPSQSRV